MKLREWKDRFLAVPWVYDVARSVAVGGIDLGATARFCAVSATDRVLDLGCGTAKLLEFLRCARYLGVDLDRRALARASRHATDSIRFHHGEAWEAAGRELQPTVVLMIGLVHHLSDVQFRAMVDRLRRLDPLPERIVTLDVSYFAGMWINNVFSRLDRGTFVRSQAAYEELFASAGLTIRQCRLLHTRLGYVRYVGYHLVLAEPARNSG